MTPRNGRRQRRGRTLLPLLALVASCLGLTVLVQPVDAAPAPEPVTVDVAAGGALYQRYCGLCHANDGDGIAGTGVESGPGLRGLPVAYVDLTIRTGRMPIVHDEVGAIEKRLTDEQRQAVVAWMTREFGLEGEIPEVLPGNAGQGQPLWLTNCAPCHSASGSGGISADGSLAPDVTGVDPTGVVEAIRVGPFEMPEFGNRTLTDEDAADIAAYVQELAAADTTPLGLTHIGRVYAGAVTGVLALVMVGALVLVVRTGRRPATPPQGAPPEEAVVARRAEEARKPEGPAPGEDGGTRS
ncbi:c-type cytochrome [Blastococcus saxobsidens]|uniref:Putative Ubiquinol-cytochrome c reductase cytochrome c subunit n=1 Tax=Blastococcus saxobsidens (strain DD2) TaxID=1146883 RepID=H6RNK1_BLASD|nr:c-type cytochrome [Blastococcus saxobsidens]CCG03948.1 putative Ubiquinol-cytochrome c reductase cytochrome c subunit [Blastococcus saxobsidens DD2]